MSRGKYRLRTWIRGLAPTRLAAAIPKGPTDCGGHSWYLSEPDLWRCHHCEVGVTRVSPFAADEAVQGRLRALELVFDALDRRAATPAVADEYRAALSEFRALVRRSPVSR